MSSQYCNTLRQQGRILLSNPDKYVIDKKGSEYPMSSHYNLNTPRNQTRLRKKRPLSICATTLGPPPSASSPLQHLLLVVSPPGGGASYLTAAESRSPFEDSSAPSAISPSANVASPLPLL
ncbi:hypothetical protein ACJJTC_012121 [Scirpophaga incertulas]